MSESSPTPPTEKNLGNEQHEGERDQRPRDFISRLVASMPITFFWYSLFVLVGVALLAPLWGEIGDWSKEYNGAITALATVAIFFLGIRQWRTMDAQRDAMNQQAGWMKSTDTRIGDQIALARDEFEAEHRPWISVDVQIDGLIKWTENGMDIPLLFTCTNMGTAPALYVWPDARVFPLHPLFPNLVSEQKRLSDQNRQRAITPHALGFAVFPSHSERQTITYTLTRVDFDRSIAYWKEIGANFAGVTAVIVGCVDYCSPTLRSLDGPKHYQTGFILELSRFDQMPGNHIADFSPDYNVLNSDQVRLTRSYYGPGITD